MSEPGEASAVPSPPIDLRLACGAVSAWAALLLLRAAAPAVLMTAAAAATLVGLLALGAAHRRPLRHRQGRRHRRRRRHGVASPVASAVAMGAFCVALVLIPYAARQAHARAAPVRALAATGTTATLELTLRGDPRRIGTREVAAAPQVAVDADADAVLAGGHRTATYGRLLVIAPAGSWRELLPGQRVRVSATPRLPNDPDELAAVLYIHTAPELIGVPPWWQRAAGSVRAALREASSGLPRDVAGLLPGLVDGDTSGLDPVLAENFRAAGLTHLVAVSGTNCSILLGVVLLVLARLGWRPRLRAVAGVAVLLAFVLVARGSPSVLRAAAMALVALGGLALGRPRRALPALAAAILALLVSSPRLAVDAGFAMSVLATGALLLIAPGWAAALRRRGVPVGLAEGVAVAAAAHMVTAPVVAVIAGRLSLVAIPANVLAEPVVVVTTVFGFAAALLAPLWLGGASVLTWVAGWPCRWLVWVADTLGGLDGATLPWPGGVRGGLLMAATMLLGWGLLRCRALRPALLAAAVVGFGVQFPLRWIAPGWPPSGWAFVACDVGQGDALVLPAGDRAAVVVDAGPDPVAVDRCLRDLDVVDVPLLALSHYHLDHVGGIAGVVHGRRVGTVLAGPLDEPVAGVRDVLDTLGSAPGRVRTPGPGERLTAGPVRLEVLGPSAPSHGTRSDPNNSSLVLRATVGGVRVLLPGDAEVAGQQALLDSGADLRADVFKVAHHGSAYFVPALLHAVAPRWAVISVGVDNDYGHPAPALLSALRELNIPVARTDRAGDVAIVERDGALRAVAHRPREAPVAGAAPERLPVEQPSPAAVRMAAWLRAPSPSTICPIRCPASSSSSVTSRCWPIAPSARSPPPPGRTTNRSSSPS